MADIGEIYNLYFKDVFRYTLSLSGNEAVAEDITQETFFKALKGIEGYKGEASIRVWLCQIAKNTYFTHYGREKRYAEAPQEWEEAAPANLEGRLIRKESAMEVHRALHRLGEPYKEVFSLRMFGELPFMQIGELFAKTESWARVTYHRAKRKLQEELS